ncbi:hypothetical protein M422DRAFT_25530 [Sphaerobolus stellatus SS14]|nr:hypothetical protein M422DRAFT_25530 [Sphaerobolus stellatus SS14]
MSCEDNAPKPTYVYKLVPSSSPVPLSTADLPEKLPVSSIDQASGFIHLSTSPQILNTLKWFFKEDEEVYVLRINYDKFESQIRWEDPKAEVCGPRAGEGMFPHLYNGLKLGKDEIERVEVLTQGEDGWESAVEKAGKEWLVW